MDPVRIQKILDAVENSSLCRTDTSPYLSIENIVFNKVKNSKLNIVLSFHWHDDDGTCCSAIFNEENLDNATIEKNIILLDCTEGWAERIILFDLKPHKIEGIK